MKENRLSLVLLAAGMGSRYGGLKQLDKLGPNGETIMDYSVNDAIAAGFDHVVFVIRKSIEEAFCSLILPKYESKIKVDYVFQELDALPEGFALNPDRTKPYGTAHAILVAKDAVHSPFTVINADDFYGADAFRTIADFLLAKHNAAIPHYAMVGYQLAKTLSENGTVSRGICQMDANGNLTGMKEMGKIKNYDGAIKSVDEKGSETVLPGETLVSMNFWGFDTSIFSVLEKMFSEFLTENNNNPTSEFQIPTVINRMIQNRAAEVKVLSSQAEWFGVTYQEDKEMVMRKLRELRIEN